jgi:hydrogenase expression/formation protein HypE
MSSDDLLFGACPLPLMDHDAILLGHGSGGLLTSQLIERVFLPALGNEVLDRLEDQAVLDVSGARLAFTTDSFVVTPIFFPGGDIGSLAVHGTVNDLAMCGAKPLYLSAGFILEEGLEIEELSRVVSSMRRAALEAGVLVVTGDTKVVGRGSGDKIFINTSGIGIVPEGVRLGADRIRPGDSVLLSGTVGDHGTAVLSLRESLGLESSIVSDSAPLHDLVDRILAAAPETHAMRDPTRGGVAGTCHEIASRAGLGIELWEDSVPVREEVLGACELLGLDPLNVANEGKLVAFVPEPSSEAALRAMRADPLGEQAVRIGVVTEAHPGRVLMRTAIGASRVLERPYGELLPRIC